MNYIKLLRIPIHSEPTYCYLINYYLGQTYCDEAGLIGSYKGNKAGSGNSVSVFKTIPDKGTWRAYPYSLFVNVSTYLYGSIIHASRHPQYDYVRTIDFWKKMWIDDTDAYDLELAFTRGNYWEQVYPQSWTSVVNLFMIVIGNHYYFAEEVVYDLVNKESINALSKWSGNTHIWTKKMEQHCNYDPMIVPSIKTAHTHYNEVTNDSGTATSGDAYHLYDTSKSWTTNQWAGQYCSIIAGTGSGQNRLIDFNTSTSLSVTPAWTTAPDATSQYHIGTPERVHWVFTAYPIDDYNAKKVRFQWASDSGFSNIIATNLWDVPIGGSTYNYQLAGIGDVRDIYKYDTYTTLYGRVRFENTNGSIYGDWSSIVTMDFTNPVDVNYVSTDYIIYPGLYEPWATYPVNYTGHQRYSFNQGIVQRGNYIDVAKRKYDNTISGGSATKTIKAYIDTYDLDGNLISSKNLGDTYNGNTIHITTRNGYSWVLFLNSNESQIVVCRYDGINVVTKMISLPSGKTSFTLNNIWFNGNVIFAASSPPVIYKWNWGTEAVNIVNLPTVLSTDLSTDFGDDGFWFEYNDGTYFGIAWYTEEIINRAMSFNQFQKNVIRV